MKNKWIAIIAIAVLVLAILLSLSFCGRGEDAPVEPTAAPTTAPTQPVQATEATEPPALSEPEWVPGISRATYAEALFSTLGIGEEVEVVGQYEDYFIISGEPYDLLVEKRFVRLASEDAFESWDGYARSGACVFDAVYMREEPIAELKLNTEVKVLEGKGNWLFIEWDGGKGYVKAADISETRIVGGGGGGGRGPIDGTDVDVSLLSAARNQGAVVKLGAYYGPEMDADFEKGTGVVLADGIEAYICLFFHGDEIKVLQYSDELVIVYLEPELTATLPRYLVALEGDEVEEPWTGYARSGAVVYKEYQRRNEVDSLKMNTEVQVLYQLPGFEYGDEGTYVVSIEGQIRYMKVSEVSKDKLKPAAGGGGAGGGGDVWTPPEK